MFGKKRLKRFLSRLTRADAHHLLDVVDKDLSVADFSGTCSTFNGFDDLLNQRVINGRFNLHLGQEVHDVFSTTIELCVAFCRPKPLTSVTVMPCTPMLDKASRTSSSLNGLMMAVTSFMCSPQLVYRGCRHRAESAGFSKKRSGDNPSKQSPCQPL